MRRHETDFTSLIAGLLFAGIAVAYLLHLAVGFTIDPELVVPALLIGLGVAGLAGSLVAVRRRNGGPGQPLGETETFEDDHASR